MKIIIAVHWTEKIVFGWMNSVLARIAAPAAPQPVLVRTKITRLLERTRTPSDAAADSSSRIAWRAAPMRLRSRTNRTMRAPTATASAHQ